MITEHDLDAAIAECNGKRNPDATTCIKLAAFYTIKSHLYPDGPNGMERTEPMYSYAPAPDGIQIDSDSEFAERVNGRQPSEVWPLIDEMMATLQVLQPRLYNAVMQRL